MAKLEAEEGQNGSDESSLTMACKEQMNYNDWLAIESGYSWNYLELHSGWSQRLESFQKYRIYW